MKASRFTILLVAIICVLATTIGGAYATWQYAHKTPSESAIAEEISFTEFEYKPEEVLPGDDTATELHQNHNNLVISIVDHTSYGLNANHKPIVRKLLEDGAGVVYSNQNVSGGNLKHMLVSSSDVEKLMFAVEYVTDTEYHAYTFPSVSNYGVGYELTVYKTVITKNGNKWEAVRSYEGKAKVANVRTSSGGSVLNIDVKTWVKT